MTSSNPYDQVPYGSNPLRQTHPDRIAAVGVLLGLDPPDPQRCRVLELGCASGGNLIPMAVELPGASFVGIDLSGEQVAVGERIIAALGLTNITLKTLSILDVGPELGTFDYILSHGVLSWVPLEVQDKIFAIAAQQLTPDGIAYISYNTFPGWYRHKIMRDMMRYHTRNSSGAMDTLRQARGLLGVLAGTPEKPDAYRLALQVLAAELHHVADYYLFHEFLAPNNEPFYFHDFVSRAKSHGLRYLAEAEFREMIVENLPLKAQQVVRHIARSSVDVEQYMDFLRNRSFRQTLVCHASRSPDGKIGPQRFKALNIATRMHSTTKAPDLESSAPVQFESSDGLMVTLEDPFLKRAMTILSEEWPMSVPFDDLRCRARQLTPGDGSEEDDTRTLGEALFQLFCRSAQSMIELSRTPPIYRRQAGERPLVSSLARYQTTTGEVVTNLRHEEIRLGKRVLAVLPYLDGTHDRAELLALMVDLRNAGQLPLAPVPNGVEPDRWLADCLEDILRDLGRSALLLA